MPKQQSIEPLLEALSQLAIISQHINVVINTRPLGYLAKDQELAMKNMMAEIDKAFVKGVCSLSDFIVPDSLNQDLPKETVKKKAKSKKVK